MNDFPLDAIASRIVLQILSTLRDLGTWSVSEAWHLCLVIIVAALVTTSIAIALSKMIAAAYIEYKKKQVVKEEWGSWRSAGLPKEAVHALAYCAFVLMALKVSFEFARAVGYTVSFFDEFSANAVAVIWLLIYALRQLKERHKGDGTSLTLRFLGCTTTTLVLMHHSDLIRRFAAPATVYAMDFVPL
jgi:hypothetical protein